MGSSLDSLDFGFWISFGCVFMQVRVHVCECESLMWSRVMYVQLRVSSFVYSAVSVHLHVCVCVCVCVCVFV